MKQRIILTIMATLAFSTNILVQSNLSTVKTETSSSKAGKVAQKNNSIFRAHLVNNEFQVWVDIDFYHSNITIPRQKVFGEIPGYFDVVRDARKWVISGATIKGREAILAIINDYGSEDLKAELKRNSDGTYTLARLDSNTMKIVVSNRWVKIPKDLIFYYR